VTDGWTRLDLDDAWDGVETGADVVDRRAWGPRLRYTAPAREVAAFARTLPRLRRLVLLGSGDFHHLTRVLLERVARPDTTVVVFDNHPDWDVRPPEWACGSWAARVARVRDVRVWGCGNFEPRLPSRLFADRSALRSGRLAVVPWRERQPPGVCRRFACVDRTSWRDAFDGFAAGLRGRTVYVSVDLDCLAPAEAVTNWESGLFTAADVAWAIGRLGTTAEIVGADVCGAASTRVHARRGQALAAWWDHRHVPAPAVADARPVNAAAFATIAAALYPSSRG
jgi:arginase family enzyme